MKHGPPPVKRWPRVLFLPLSPASGAGSWPAAGTGTRSTCVGAAVGAGTVPPGTTPLPLRRGSGDVWLVFPRGPDAARVPAGATSLSPRREHCCPARSPALYHRLPSHLNPANITAALQSWRALSWEVLPATGTSSSRLVN